MDSTHTCMQVLIVSVSTPNSMALSDYGRLAYTPATMTSRLHGHQLTEGRHLSYRTRLDRDSISN